MDNSKSIQLYRLATPPPVGRGHCSRRPGTMTTSQIQKHQPSIITVIASPQGRGNLLQHVSVPNASINIAHPGFSMLIGFPRIRLRRWRLPRPDGPRNDVVIFGWSFFFRWWSIHFVGGGSAARPTGATLAVARNAGDGVPYGFHFDPHRPTS